MQKPKNPGYEKFSQENVERLCAALQAIDESQSFITSDVSEVLRDLAQAIIWSDKKDNASFDVFLEQDMITTLENIVTNAESPSTVKAEVLRFVTMMLHNLTLKENIYYICSKNHLNRMISIDLNENDDELLSVYVSFLKSLALRCDDTTVQFFFVQQLGAFPLFDYAAKLINTSDRMARGAARQVVISVARLHASFLAPFMEKALPDVLGLVSHHAWLQIGALSKLVRCYRVAAGETSVAAPVPTVECIRSQMEDVLDDLFYINDIFEMSSVVVEEKLRATLEAEFIDPLVALVEASLDSTPSSSPEADVIVDPPVVLSVLTRWLLLEKETRTHKVLLDRLLHHDGSDPTECLLGRVLSKGCLHCLSVGVVLLAATVRVGAFSELGVMVEHDECNKGCEANTTEDSGRNVAEDSVPGGMPCGDGEWEKCCFSEALNALPSREEFLECAKRGVGCDAARKSWCVSLLGAIYRFISCCPLVRLSVFDVSLSLLRSFLPRHSEQGRTLAALSLVCEGILRRRLVAYCDALNHRRGNKHEDGASRSQCAADKDCLRSACETLFLEMERACGALEPNAEHSADKLGREVGLLLPLLPGCEFVLKDQSCCMGCVVSCPQRLADVQRVVEAAIPRRHRAAHNSMEQKEAELVMWVRVRDMLYDSMQKGGSFLLQLRRYRASHTVGSCVDSLPRNSTPLRCEFVKLAVPAGKEPNVLKTGTPMYMFLLDAEIIFVTYSSAELPPTESQVKGTVAFAMPIIYIQAAVSVPSFGVAFTYFHPNDPKQLHVVLRHSKVAQSVVNEINRRSAFWRCHGAALVCNALNAQPSC